MVGYCPQRFCVYGPPRSSQSTSSHLDQTNLKTKHGNVSVTFVCVSRQLVDRLLLTAKNWSHCSLRGVGAGNL